MKSICSLSVYCSKIKINTVLRDFKKICPSKYFILKQCTYFHEKQQQKKSKLWKIFFFISGYMDSFPIQTRLYSIYTTTTKKKTLNILHIYVNNQNRQKTDIQNGRMDKHIYKYLYRHEFAK